jgi:hypothetical protein
MNIGIGHKAEQYKFWEYLFLTNPQANGLYISSKHSSNKLTFFFIDFILKGVASPGCLMQKLQPNWGGGGGGRGGHNNHIILINLVLFSTTVFPSHYSFITMIKIIIFTMDIVGS